MFGSIGGFEILVLLGIGLIVFGPKRLPEMGRWVARGVGELRKAAAEVKSAVEKEADLGDVGKVASDLRQAVNTEARKLFTEIEDEANRVERTDPKPVDPPAGVEPRKSAPGPEAGPAETPPGPEKPQTPKPPEEQGHH